jgi:hypothetical protein
LAVALAGWWATRRLRARRNRWRCLLGRWAALVPPLLCGGWCAWRLAAGGWRPG